MGQGFERVDLSHNLEGLSDPTFADEILKVLRFNESVSHIGLEGIEDTGTCFGDIFQLAYCIRAGSSDARGNWRFYSVACQVLILGW